MALKSVLITGCSEGGIGFALAQEFQKRGLHVFATARSIDKMASLEQLPNVTLLTLDVTSEASVSAAVTAVRSATGDKLDYLVNNAGSLYCMPILDSNIQEAKAIFDVNFWGVIAVTQAFSPLIISSRGCIVNISSIAGLMYPPFLALYAASKAAINAVSETLRLELKPFGVKVVTVITGSIESNIYVNSSEYRLPADSRYLEIEKDITTRADGSDANLQKSTLDDFSRSLVSDVLSGASGKIYRGKMSSIARFLMYYMPTAIIDRLNVLGTGLERVSPEADQHKKTI